MVELLVLVLLGVLLGSLALEAARAAVLGVWWVVCLPYRLLRRAAGRQ